MSCEADMLCEADMPCISDDFAAIEALPATGSIATEIATKRASMARPTLMAATAAQISDLPF